MASSRYKSRLLDKLRHSIAGFGLSVGEDEEGLYLYATRDFDIGDFIITVQPSVNIPKDLKIVCNSCLQPCDDYCSACGIVPFCKNEDCQKRKQLFHPLECMVLQELDVDTWKMVTPPVYAMLKLLLNRLSEMQTGTGGFSWSTWEFFYSCLPCHPNNSLNLQDCVEMAKSVKLILRNLLGYFPRRDIIDIFPKLCGNIVCIQKNRTEIGWALFPLISLAYHSHYPNMEVSFEINNCATVYAVEYIPKGKKMSIDFANAGGNGVDTPEKFACFMCTCSQCCQPAGILESLDAGFQLVVSKFREVCAGYLGISLKVKPE